MGTFPHETFLQLLDKKSGSALLIEPLKLSKSSHDINHLNVWKNPVTGALLFIDPNEALVKIIDCK